MDASEKTKQPPQVLLERRSSLPLYLRVGKYRVRLMDVLYGTTLSGGFTEAYAGATI
jgi:hypothetical protein